MNGITDKEKEIIDEAIITVKDIQDEKPAAFIRGYLLGWQDRDKENQVREADALRR